MIERIGQVFQRNRPLRFLIVGGCNTLACYGVYAGLLWAGLPFWLANFGSLVFGILLGFHTQGRFVFGNTDRRRIFRFVGAWLVIYGLQTMLIGVLIRTGLSASLAGLIILPGMAVVSYVVQKFVVFTISAPLASE